MLAKAQRLVRRRRRHRLFGVALGALAFVTGSGVVAGCFVFTGPRWEGPASGHFNGERFVNQEPIEKPGFFKLMKWMISRDHGPWAEVIGAEPGPPPPRRVGSGGLRVTFINHATTLLQQDGVNVLTDPIWSERSSPVSFAGPKRVRPPGLRFEDLPPIDVVVLSHSHYDHFDLATLKRLYDVHHPRFFTGLGNRALLEDEGIHGVTEVDWWQEFPIAEGVTLASVPAQHFSNRGLCDSDGTLWTGYVVKGPAGVSYFAGDTGFGPHFQQIRARYGAPRLALLPVGAFRPEWFMRPVHVSPKEALDAHHLLGAGTSVAIHFGTFDLGDDGQFEASREIEEAVASSGDALRFLVLGFGEGRDVPAIP